MGLVRQLVNRPEESDLKRGSELVQRAQAAGAKTQRERDYINALALFYLHYDKVDYEERMKAYSRAMDRVCQQYPEDQQAAVFYALSLLTWAVDHDPPWPMQRKRSRSSLGYLKKTRTILAPSTT